MEKYALDVREERAQKHLRPYRSRKGRLVLLLISVASLAHTSYIAYNAAQKGVFAPLGLHGWSTSPNVHQYSGEHIKWTECGEAAGKKLECSELDVPMDQFNQTLSGDKTFNLKLIRLRGNKDATKNILLNPGGPGGSGVGFLAARAEQLTKLVGDNYHLLSFDPRGINGSSPRAVCGASVEERKSHPAAHQVDAVADSGESYAWASTFVRACEDNLGEYGKYINTPQTAADMNTILDAIGQDNLWYWGFSYGTTLGQTYAQLFPDRAERVIIDGVSNQKDWYNLKIQTEELVDQERVLTGFVDECVKAGEDCKLNQLGLSATELRKVIVESVTKLKVDPMPIYVNETTYGSLTYYMAATNAIFSALYKPAKWYELADKMTSFLRGNGTDLWLANRAQWFDPGDDSTEIVMFNDGPSGEKYWSQSRLSLLEDLEPVIKNNTFFQHGVAFEYYPKQQWRLPKIHAFKPRDHVHTRHPLLILSTTYDPICPLVSARAANEMFEGSRLLELKAFGHCTIAMPSVCVAKHVQRFFATGALPERGAQCEVDGPYFVKPEDQMQPRISTADGTINAEEMAIHMAQVALSHDTGIIPRQEWR
ncbi:hypothetical protein PYCC9005_004063 [Savitreella phatthalungensis]